MADGARRITYGMAMLRQQSAESRGTCERWPGLLPGGTLSKTRKALIADYSEDIFFMVEAATTRTLWAERQVEEVLSLPLISEFVFRSPKHNDPDEKEVIDHLIVHKGRRHSDFSEGARRPHESQCREERVVGSEEYSGRLEADLRLNQKAGRPREVV